MYTALSSGQVRRDKRLFPDTKLLFFSKFSSVLHRWWKYLKHLALSSRVHIDQNGGCSNNLELVEDHTDSLVAVEAVRVVLHQFEPVRPYFQVVSAQSEARSYPRTDFQRGLSIRGSSTGIPVECSFEQRMGAVTWSGRHIYLSV